MGNTPLVWLRRESTRFGALGLAGGQYLLASFGCACRARDVRPSHALVVTMLLAVAGMATAASLAGWSSASGSRARTAAELAQTQRELAVVEAELRTTQGQLAQAETAKATPVLAQAGTNPAQQLLRQIDTLKATLDDVSRQRRTAHAQYEQAIAALAKSNKEKESLAAIKARLEHKLIAMHEGSDSSVRRHDGDVASVASDTASPDAADGNVPAPPSGGFDLRRFLLKLGVRASGEGGPFVPAGSLREHGADPQAMKILRSLPLSAPLAHYVVASPFGVRADPINEHEAFHTGVDLDAPYRSPVYNTAPGVVVFAGWAGAYGRMVEIDHGHGIHTRYCHLNRITVTLGEKLRRRVRIGLLGSTGRSTGPHVHYEVRVDGVPQDPEKFLRAGRSVVLVTDGQ